MDREEDGKKYKTCFRLGPERVREMEESAFYLAIVDERFFKSIRVTLEFTLAKELGKDILIALKHGVDLPAEWISGANIIAIERWKCNRKSIQLCAEKLITEWESQRVNI